ncbi:hypothetical protein JB92DRAFT_3025807 [Gautieria morchelliformis]|nr:hypothetical protein JB92DRAFT_3025807 [Gautieria morchelliformis]
MERRQSLLFVLGLYGSHMSLSSCDPVDSASTGTVYFNLDWNLTCTPECGDTHRHYLFGAIIVIASCWPQKDYGTAVRTMFRALPRLTQESLHNQAYGSNLRHMWSISDGRHDESKPQLQTSA